MMNIVVDVTSQGYGHLAQTGPVIRSFLERSSLNNANCNVTVRCNSSPTAVLELLGSAFSTVPLPEECLMVTNGANKVNVDQSIGLFNTVHAQWDYLVERETRQLSLFRPTLYLSNVSYLGIAAAKKLSIPAFCLSSINWLEFFRHYCDASRESRMITQQIETSYASADCFFQITPHMDMPTLKNARSVGPIARCGKPLQALRDMAGNRYIVLITSGGLSFSQSLEVPFHPSIHWVVQGARGLERRSDLTLFDDLAFPFIDVLATADVIVGKDGYGTLVEAACHGKRLIMVPRPSWPETACLVDWGKCHCAFLVEKSALTSPQRLIESVFAILSLPRKPAIVPNGAETIACMIEAMISR